MPEIITCDDAQYAFNAVDNLSACALTVAMCRFLVQNPSYIPEDTEIRFVSFGSEEAGLRGSRRYVERHQDELKRLDARILNFEMVAMTGNRKTKLPRLREFCFPGGEGGI